MQEKIDSHASSPNNELRIVAVGLLLYKQLLIQLILP